MQPPVSQDSLWPREEIRVKEKSLVLICQMSKNMEKGLSARVEELEIEITKLQNRPKDGWDVFQIIASLLIPASIAAVGFMVSESLKKAEIESAERRAKAQQEVARVSARVGQAQLVNSFMESLLSTEIRRRKLAIESVLIALPDEGPRLVRIVSETDPSDEVRVFAATQQRYSTLLDQIDNLSDTSALSLVKDPPVALDPGALAMVSARDPNKVRYTDAEAARQILKMVVVSGERSESSLDAWNSAILALE